MSRDPQVPPDIRRRDPVRADAAREAEGGHDGGFGLQVGAGVEATRRIDREVIGLVDERPGRVVAKRDIVGLEPVAAVHVDAELGARARDGPHRARLDVEVFRGDVRALDAAAGRGRGVPILVGSLIGGAKEPGHGQGLESPVLFSSYDVVKRCESS